MIRSYHNCNNNGCVKVDTSGVTYKYEYAENELEDFAVEETDGWNLNAYGWSTDSDGNKKINIPKGMNPKINNQSSNSISFSVSRDGMKKLNINGYYSARNVMFTKTLDGYDSVKSVKCKIKSDAGNMIHIGIKFEKENSSLGIGYDKFCTGSETEFEILTPASGIKNLQVYFEPWDKGSYEVSDIQIE